MFASQAGSVQQARADAGEFLVIDIELGLDEGQRAAIFGVQPVEHGLDIGRV